VVHAGRGARDIEEHTNLGAPLHAIMEALEGGGDVRLRGDHDGLLGLVRRVQLLAMPKRDAVSTRTGGSEGARSMTTIASPAVRASRRKLTSNSRWWISELTSIR